MSKACVRARVDSVAFALLLMVLIALPAPVLAQRAKVSFRIAPFGSPNLSPLFKIDVVEPVSRGGVVVPSFTLTDTKTGPEFTNISLLFPDVALGTTAVASRLGDQPLPSTFVSSPLSGTSVKKPMRGVSFSTAGATPWTFLVGQLNTGSGAPGLSSGAPAVAALALSLAPDKRMSVAPRLLVPVGARETGQTSIGTSIRAKVSPHISVVSDVAAAATARTGWAPLASAGVSGRWAGTEVETSVLRGAPSHGTTGPAIFGTLDREVARGRLQPLPGLTISGFASRSRPANIADASDTKVGSFGVAYERLPYGNLMATRQTELTSQQALEITRVEWRHAAAGGLTLRYTETRATHADAPATDSASKLVEVDLPRLTPQRAGGRLNLRAALTANSSAATPGIGSKLSGRVGVYDEIALFGETELGLAGRDGGQFLRALRVTTDVPVVQDTSIQLLYTYRSGTPFSFDRAFEARVSRTINLFTW
jgi:hypothetical protein